MARARVRAVAAAVFLLLLWAGAAEGKAAKKVKAPHSREDVPFIRCAVCQEVAKVLARDVKQMKSEKKAKEIDILEKIEKVCDPDTPAGNWITHLDVVEDGSKLKLVQQEEEGSCKEECRTIARACEDTIGYHDTDLAETLFSQDLNRIALEKLLCRDLTKDCTKPTPPLPAGRKPGPAFAPKSEKERYLDELTYKMGDAPGKMSLYSREDMEEEFLRGGAGSGEGGDDDDEEEEDDDDMFSNAYREGAGGSKAAKAARQEQGVGAWEAVAGLVTDVVGGAKTAVAGAVQRLRDAVGGGGKGATGGAKKTGSGKKPSEL